MSSHKRVIIIGAGIGGLSTAIRLAAHGHNVQVLERLPQVGGKLNQVQQDGFSFDTGPSLITMPHVLYDLFHAAHRRLEDYLDLLPLDPTCRYFYRDGITLNAWRNHTQMALEFARLNPRDGVALHRFLDYAGTLYQAAADPFLYHSLGNPLDILHTFTRYVLKGHPHTDLASEQYYSDQEHRLEGNEATLSTRLSRLQAVLAALSPTTLHQCVSQFFEDEHLHQLFDRYATYNGSSPYQLASVYSIIPYIEMTYGGWYLHGGIYTLARALEQVARELDVTIETNCHVQRILVERGKARGVVLDTGCVRRSDVVIANSDVVTTHREMLSPAVRNQRFVRQLERLEPSCSGFVLLLGVNKRYPQLAHHNIFFSDDYPTEFTELFTQHVPLCNPTIYICASSRTDPSQAPSGHENLFILVNAPYLTAQNDWKRDTSAYRNHILGILATYPQIDLHDIYEHIVYENIITPAEFQQYYGANAGSIYGLSSNSRMAPFMRPANRSQQFRSLYFVGGSTHPGGGVPLVMLSGKIVAELIEKDIQSHNT